jgi:IclR family transcriptional regulator, KDG regulon repressor
MTFTETAGGRPRALTTDGAERTEMATSASSTVTKSFDVLWLFRTHSLLGAAECARLLDMPRASAHRMLVSLASAGALEVTPRGQYRLSLEMFELGQQVPHHRVLFDAAYLPMERLVSRTRMSAHLAVRRDLQLMYLVKLQHARDRTSAKAGQRNHLHATAVGKVLLANAEEDIWRDVLDQGLYPYTRHTITTRERLCEELATVREEGIAYDHQERTLGLISMAMPIRERSDRTVAAVSVLAPSEKFRLGLNSVRSELAETKQLIEVGLGRRTAS